MMTTPPTAPVNGPHNASVHRLDLGYEMFLPPGKHPNEPKWCVERVILVSSCHYAILTMPCPNDASNVYFGSQAATTIPITLPPRTAADYQRAFFYRYYKCIDIVALCFHNEVWDVTKARRPIRQTSTSNCCTIHFVFTRFKCWSGSCLNWVHKVRGLALISC